MKKTLAFAILIVLALASFNVLSLPHVKAQTAEAQILSYSWYTAPSTTTSAEYINDLVAVGEVQNTGSTTAGIVWVMGQAYDSNGTFLASTEASAMATNLAPNQKAPFYLDFFPEESVTQDQSWVSNALNVTVSVFSVSNATDTVQYNGLTTSNLNGINNAGTYTVTGTISNSGDQNVGDVAVVATYYNSNSTVVAVSLTDLGAGLAQGQSTSFSVTPWDNTSSLSNEIVSYTVQLQSTPVAPIATPEPTATPTTQPTSSQSGGSNPTQNSGTAGSIAPYLLGVVVAASVIAVIAAFLFLRRQNRSHQAEAPTPIVESSAQL